MKRPSRDPGNQIKSLLRREVNYGCPVRHPHGAGCGCPILTFHHFDPSWVGNYVHNPDGMIALCPEHHLQADGGLWSREQLKQFKKNPFVDDVLRIQWPWQPETLIMKVGPSLVMGSGSPIRLDGLPAFRFYPHVVEGLGARTVLFDSDIRDANKQRWFRVSDGWFDLRLEKTTDVIFTPQTKTILAKHDDQTFVSLQFLRCKVDDFKSWIPSFMTKKEIAISAQKTVETVGAIDSDGFVPVVIMEGKFRTDKVAVAIKGDRMHFECFIPGLEEEFDFHSWVVDDQHRAILRLGKGPEFFSLG
jgi:hypothetical protein